MSKEKKTESKNLYERFQKRISDLYGKHKDSKNRRRNTNILLIVGVMIAVLLLNIPTAVKEVDTSEGLEILKSQPLKYATMNDGTQTVSLVLQEDYTHEPINEDDREKNLGTKISFPYSKVQGEQIAELIERAESEEGYQMHYPETSLLDSTIQTLLPLSIVLILFLVILSKTKGGIGGVGKANAKEFSEEEPEITFKDVAGVDEAVQELDEVKEFLQSPDKFLEVGAKIPRGVLLYGAPGTGKTLLAKAVAGEAGVPFYSISGSEFLEMFVGVGASRVRDLFDKARKNSPAIVFVDEIDAVGRHRGTGMGGGNDEREQTLNQMLVELDGFDDRDNVIMIAATNRPDILDKALLRPGRFDRQISVEVPNMKGRKEILKIHSKNKPVEELDFDLIARRTPGFSGADLANVMNESALLAARSEKTVITMEEVDEAIDRVIAGPQKYTRVLSEDDKTLTAYHEAGHALVAAALHHSDPVTKVTILPRGQALGYTMVMPEEDSYSKTKNQLLDSITYSMGGKVVEELIFKDPTTGAANDIQKATKTARAMVAEYGMSETVGNIRLAPEGESNPNEKFAISDTYISTVDEEAKTLIEKATDEAAWIVENNMEILETLVERLLEEETLNEEELGEIFKEVKKYPYRLKEERISS